MHLMELEVHTREVDAFSLENRHFGFKIRKPLRLYDSHDLAMRSARGM